MDKLRIEPFFHAPTGTWSYVVDAGGDAVVIDPVLDYTAASGRIATTSAAAILEYIAARGLQVHYVLETHAHADHLSAAAVVRADTGVPLAIGAGIRDVQAHFATLFGWDANEPGLRDAFDRLLDAFGPAVPDDRTAIRTRLLDYFSLTGVDDPRVALARRRLATLLY